jgi:hypothetical protein
MTHDLERLESALNELRGSKIPIDMPTIERTLIVILEHLIALPSIELRAGSGAL